MKTLYVSQQGCYVSLAAEQLLVKQGQTLLTEVQLPLLAQVLIFGHSQITTQAVRECLRRDIPIAYLSRLGYCYGRVIAIERGYRQLVRYQQSLSRLERLLVAQQMVRSKILNGKTLLLRQARKGIGDSLAMVAQNLVYLADQCLLARDTEQLMGLEGTAAVVYFGGFEQCLRQADFVFGGRVKRPPGNPVNALLSFGYMVLWNHLLSLLELQGLDPYYGFLHADSARHAALASDLIEQFRAPVVDSLVLYLINRGMVSSTDDFEFRDGGCFLNNRGRRKFLQAFLARMEQPLGGDAESDVPRWEMLTAQVRAIKNYVYDPSVGYQPYLIR